MAYVKGSVGVVQNFSLQVPSQNTFSTIVVPGFVFVCFLKGVNVSHERR